MTIGIDTVTANAAVSVVSGLIKLTGRVDGIIAEETAVLSEIGFASAPVRLPPPAIAMKRDLKRFAEETKGHDPDPLQGDRGTIETLVGEADPAPDQLLHWMEIFLPEKVEFTIDDPDRDFQAKIRKKREAWDLDDNDIARATTLLAAGEDKRDADLAWQIATATISIVAEVAIANQALVLRDDRARPVVVAVLERFASEEFTDVGSPRLLFKFVLRATLNGALDAKDELGNDKVWVDGLLSALATAREESAAGDDFVVGLVSGKGYSTLIKALLNEGADHLTDDDANNFEKVLADVLKDAANKVEGSTSFERFFKDNWGSLVRAGLASVHSNGAAIFDDQKPILRETLLSAIQVLAEPGDREFLSGEHLTSALEAAIGAVASNPELLDDAVREQWMRDLLTSVAGVIKTNGIKQTLSSAGAQVLVQDIFGVLAVHPELLSKHPKIVQEIAGSILEQLSVANSLRLEDVAQAGIAGALMAVAENPALLDTKYAPVLANFAGGLGEIINKGSLSAVHGEQLIGIAASAIASNPTLFIDTQDELAVIVFQTVLDKVQSDPENLIHGSTLIELVDGVLQLLAARGTALLGDESAPELAERIGTVIDVALQQAAIELGHRLDLTNVGTIVVRLTWRWAAGEVPALNTDNAEFQQIFAEIAEDVLELAA